MMVTGAVRSSRASASWAALGAAAAMRDRRQSYQRHTSSGSLPNAAGVARSSGR